MQQHVDVACVTPKVRAAATAEIVPLPQTMSSRDEIACAEALHICACTGHTPSPDARTLIANVLACDGDADEIASMFTDSSSVLYIKLAAQMRDMPLVRFGFADLCGLHAYLFEGIEDSVGVPRRVELVREGAPIAPLSEVSRLLAPVFDVEVGRLVSGECPADTVLDRIARVAMSLRYLHLFECGDMALTRAFLHQLGWLLGWDLRLRALKTLDANALLNQDATDPASVERLAAVLHRTARWASL